MRRMKKYTVPVLLLCFALCLCSCGGASSGEYRTIEAGAEERLYVAFRKGDRLRDTVTAALKALAAEGVVAEISRNRFGRDITTIEGDPNAPEGLGYEVEPRSFIAGLCASASVMSSRNPEGRYTGFDVDVASAVCERLGWDIRFRAVSPENAELELAAGNIDAAWGVTGIDADEFDLSPPYAENTKIIVVLPQSDIKKLAQLDGKILGIKNTDLRISETGDFLPGKIRRTEVFSSSDALFSALNNGKCDAILTDSLILEYYLYINGKT